MFTTPIDIGNTGHAHFFPGRFADRPERCDAIIGFAPRAGNREFKAIRCNFPEDPQ